MLFLKRVFICILCAAVLLTGCGIEVKSRSANGATAGNNSTSEGNGDAGTVGFDIKHYDGQWYGEGYELTIDKETGETLYDYGAWVSLDTENSKVSIYDVSSPPSSRIAEVDATYEITGSKANFEFDDDGWGNAGYGTIEFKDNELLVDITLTAESSEANWEIFDGDLTFFRNKNIVRVDQKDTGNTGAYSDTDIGGSIDPGNADLGSADIVLGDTGFVLDKPVDYSDLISLTSDELGILRNAIFAKHGYIFKTKKYADYFSSIDWYNPTTEDVNSMLTKLDKSNIALIQKVERFSEKKIKQTDEEKKLIGFWHEGMGVGAGYSFTYRFYSDGTYKYVTAQNSDSRNVAHAGRWFVHEGSLYLRIEREGVRVGGEADDQDIDEAGYKIETRNPCLPSVLKIKFKKVEGSECLEIDGSDFFRLDASPDGLNDIYDGYKI